MILFLASYRSALVYYSLLIAILFAGFSYDVVAPHRQVLELGYDGFSHSESSRNENRKFSDFTNVFVPEIAEHLTAPRSGLLALWSNRTELGRPLYQISGFSSAYLPSFLISRLVDDPYSFATILSLAYCFLAGLFILLFAREVGLTPAAGMIAALMLATSPMFMYWLSFPMFLASWCWSAGVLWALTRLARRQDILSWGFLSFCSHSLLMTAYPQSVVFHAYVLGGYGLWLAYRQLCISRFAVVKFIALSTSGLVAGLAVTLPVYRDLTILWLESARVAPDPSFFTIVLPKITTMKDLVRFFVLSTVPEIFGNPVAASFPFNYDGLSVKLVVIFFSFVSLITSFKKTWGWWLAIGLMFLFTFIRPLYIFGIKYLLFNLSRSTPLGSIILPITIIAAFGVDAFAQTMRQREFSRTVLLCGILTVLLIAICIMDGLVHDVPIQWWLVCGLIFVSGLLVAQYDRTRPNLLILAVTLNIGITSYPLMLRQDPQQIAKTSPLVEKIRAILQPDGRYAVVAPGVSVLPPNLNATLGLSSVHSYNSLSPTRYHTLIQSLGGEVKTYGRWNESIDPDYASAMFWMSNISLLLSPRRLVHENLTMSAEESGVYLYKVASRMGESLQVFPEMKIETGSQKIFLHDPRNMIANKPVKILDQGDVLLFEVKSSVASVFLLSQKFHRDWIAIAETNQGWYAVKTLEVNGVFQGVLLPPETRRVRLDFKPYSRYAWTAHGFWFLLSLVVFLKFWRRYRKMAMERV